MTTKVCVINFGPDTITVQAVDPRNPARVFVEESVFPGQVSDNVYVHNTQVLRVLEGRLPGMPNDEGRPDVTQDTATLPTIPAREPAYCEVEGCILQEISGEIVCKRDGCPHRKERVRVPMSDATGTVYSHPDCVHVYCSQPEVCRKLADGCQFTRT
jgi:hypothetical protein